MKFHPIANLFPMLQEVDLESLAADIKENGLRESVWLFEGKVLDGRNRSIACEMAGVKVRTREFKGTTRKEAIAFVWSENFHRRHLTSSQAAMAVAERKTNDPDFMREVVEPLVEEAKERKRAAGGDKKSAKAKAQKSLVKKVSQAKTRATIAKLHGTNATTLADCEKILAEHPEQVAAIKSGEKSVTQAKREIKEGKREGKRKANAAKAKRTRAIESLKNVFSTLLVDPPWSWDDEGDVNQLGRAKPDYGTMTLDQLANLPVLKVVADDAHIYCWVTNRSLPKVFGLLDAWGFRYITLLTWPKPSFGMGNYFRGQTEHIAFGVRGSLSLQVKDASTLLPTWKRGRKHSEKPGEIHAFIERCSPGPYLELFGRKQVANWSCWGADA